MRLVVASEDYLAFGVRCTHCQRFLRVGEGCQIPRCDCEGEPAGQGQWLEHHTMGCLEACGSACACPCHTYRPREGAKSATQGSRDEP